MARLVRGLWGTVTPEQREASLKKLGFFLLACASAGFSQQGVLLYRKHCAQCHDSAQAHAPAFTSLRTMSETALLRAMETGTMREPAKAMTAQERLTLAAYLSAGHSETATSTTP